MSWLAVADAVLSLAGEGATLLSHADRPWKSGSFAGRRHTFTLDFVGPEAVLIGQAFLSLLPEHEFAIPGYMVADAEISWTNHQCAAPPTVTRLTTEVSLLLVQEG